MGSDPKDYYATLGVDRDSSLDTIKLAYRRLARTSHPDLVSQDGSVAEDIASRRMAELNEAYAVLSQASQRDGHDRLLRVREGSLREAKTRPRRGSKSGPVVGAATRAETPGRARAGVVVDNVVGAYLGHVHQELVGTGSSGRFRPAELEGFDWTVRSKGILASDWIAVRGLQELTVDHVRRYQRHADKARREVKGLLRGNRMLFVLAFYRIEDPEEVLAACRRMGASLKRTSKIDTEAVLALSDVATARLMPMTNVEKGSWAEPLIDQFHVRAARKR